MKNWRARMRKRVEEFRSLLWFHTLRGKRNLVLFNAITFGIDCVALGKISSADNPSVLFMVFMIFLALFSFYSMWWSLRSLVELARKK